MNLLLNSNSHLNLLKQLSSPQTRYRIANEDLFAAVHGPFECLIGANCK